MEAAWMSSLQERGGKTVEGQRKARKDAKPGRQGRVQQKGESEEEEQSFSQITNEATEKEKSP